MIRSTHNGLTRRRFSRDDYYRMANAGILTRETRVELLDGDVVLKDKPSPLEASVVARLSHCFIPQLGGRVVCRVRAPIVLDDYCEPEPDMTLIEVADASVETDRGAKLRLYADAGIREYWVIDLNRRVLIVHRQPTGGEYASVQQYDGDARVAPEALADVELAIGPLFGSKA